MKEAVFGEKGLMHSVTLDKDRCKGCVNCIKRCPTQAIRVRNGKADILSERCIDCGLCIRVCPHKAKKAVCDDLGVIKEYKYTVALPPPSLYAQFNNLSSQKGIINALKAIGFDDVYEVARAAEAVSTVSSEYIAAGDPDSLSMPVISTACPAVTRLIAVRYPDLLDNLLPVITPAELAGKLAREKAKRETGLSDEEIGCIFISPCPAKVSSAYSPLGVSKRHIDAAVSVVEVYPLILKHMEKNKSKEGSIDESTEDTAGYIGVNWGGIGGEGTGLQITDRCLAADGIENVITVLEDLESHKYDIDFVELNACPAGCVGGVLQVENPYVARVKLQKLKSSLKEKNSFASAPVADNLFWDTKIEYVPVMELGSTREESFDRYNKLQELLETLPGIDCGSCGAPTCEAFAEDVVKGNADKNDCVIIMKEQMERMYKQMEAGTDFCSDKEQS